MFPYVNFIIAGDGNKRIDLEQMREIFKLQDRVQLLGALPHEEIRNCLIKGHIFLNTSLTEAFCIAIVEAASCGLLVVSTKVGGVPEVLPIEMIIFSQPNKSDLVQSVSEAIQIIKNNKFQPAAEIHQKVSNMYSWNDVAKRTELVYKKARMMKQLALKERVLKYGECGKFAGILGMMIIIVDYILLWFLEYWDPREEIDLAPKFDLEYFRQHCRNIIDE